MSDSKGDAVAFKYVGAGEYLPGIPARDITQAELASLNMAELEGSKLYKKQRKVSAAAEASQGSNSE